MKENNDLSFEKIKVIEKYKNKRILVIYGGWSKEREISLLTGKAILKSLLNLGLNAIGIDLTLENIETSLDGNKFDIVYIALHGRGGEDGKIQALLDLKKIYYTGSGALASGIAMNKVFTKDILFANGIPTPNFLKLDVKKVFNLDDIQKSLNDKNLHFPLIIKPVNEGSAIGVFIIENIDKLMDAIKKVKNIDSEILIEKYIKGREFTVGIIGDFVLPVLEIVSDNNFYDYEAKYKNGKSKHFIPKDLDIQILEKMQYFAKKAFDIIGCKAVARVDFMFENDEIFVLEINTVPGMTETSLLPNAAKECGLSFDELVLFILDSSFRENLYFDR
ncbi:MAG: D-alanine--D-alanine ligase [Elusimicrobiota bacterium]|jgi:D-alanine-D-alanine ligase|nr:D-alanine--D-alanine ligase [Elusimicrobiota bacterium]